MDCCSIKDSQRNLYSQSSDCTAAQNELSVSDEDVVLIVLILQENPRAPIVSNYRRQSRRSNERLVYIQCLTSVVCTFSCFEVVDYFTIIISVKGESVVMSAEIRANGERSTVFPVFRHLHLENQQVMSVYPVSRGFELALVNFS